MSGKKVPFSHVEAFRYKPAKFISSLNGTVCTEIPPSNEKHKTLSRACTIILSKVCEYAAVTFLIPSANSSLSIPILKIPDISRKIAVLMLRFRLLSLVFALIRQNKGKLFFFTRRPPYPAVLRRSVLLPLSRVRRYSSWYSHPHVPEVPERPLAVRRLRAGYS